jgi:phytoene synthase
VGAATGRVPERVAAEVARARALFADGAAVLDLVTPSIRPGMRLALAVYGRVLDRVERIGFDVVGRRAALPPWELAAAVAGGVRA